MNEKHTGSDHWVMHGLLHGNYRMCTINHAQDCGVNPMTDTLLSGDLLRFRIDRIFQSGPSTPAVVLLAEEAGERFVAIQVGPREAVGLKAAIDSAPTPSAADERGIVIAELVDGSFRSQLMEPRGSGGPPTPIRTSDALTLAIRTSAPVYVSSNVGRLAGVYRDDQKTRSGGDDFAASAQHPVAVFGCRPKQGSKVRIRGMAVLMSVSTSYFVWQLITMARANGASSVASAAPLIVFYIVMTSVIALVMLRWTRPRDERMTLHVSPAGIRWILVGSAPVDGAWREFTGSGLVGPIIAREEGILFRRPKSIGASTLFLATVKGIPLVRFEENWRSGELGRLIRMYAPRALGIPQPDPDGGSVAF
jgi:bifunctional DNase/RNase